MRDAGLLARGDKMKGFLLFLVMAAMLAGCAASRIRSQFNERLGSYIGSLRLHDWDSAALFASDRISDAFERRVRAASGVRMVDCRVLDKTYDAKRLEGVADVEIEYYRDSSPVVKTLHDRQKWEYLDENGSKRWRLVSLLPRFK